MAEPAGTGSPRLTNGDYEQRASTVFLPALPYIRVQSAVILIRPVRELYY